MASSSTNMEKSTAIKVEKGDVEKSRTYVDEIELEDGRSDISTKAPRTTRRKRLFSAFARNLDPSSVGRKRAFWARGLVVLAILTMILGMAFL
jgi:hypothetical protein